MRKAHLPIDKRFRPGIKRRDTWGFSCHWVGGMPRWTASGIRDMWETEARYSSANIVVDIQGPLEIIPIDEIAYHSGTTDKRRYRKVVDGFRDYDDAYWYPGKNLVGVEFCHQEDNGDPGPIVYKHLVHTLADLCLQYDRDPRKRILRHHDITGALCPKWFVVNPELWLLFIEDVEKAVIEYLTFEKRRKHYL